MLYSLLAESRGAELREMLELEEAQGEDSGPGSTQPHVRQAGQLVCTTLPAK